MRHRWPRWRDVDCGQFGKSTTDTAETREAARSRYNETRRKLTSDRSDTPEDTNHPMIECNEPVCRTDSETRPERLDCNDLTSPMLNSVNAVLTRSAVARLNEGPDGHENHSADVYDTAIRKLAEIDMTDNEQTAANQTDERLQTEFKSCQQEDPALQHLWQMARKNSEQMKIINGLLYRRVPGHVLAVDEYALVVPAHYEIDVIRAAHSAPLAGHYGARKFEQKIVPLFYFPKMRRKIWKFIKKCHECQMVKPIRRSERQPLQPMDILKGHPFQDITMDILGGDWPLTQRKNKYMLVLICNLSRWVHIIPLRNLRAASIADALIDTFAWTGVPKFLRSDNMASFRSEIMQELRRKLGVEARFSAPLHYCSHGIVERVQATIEMVIRKFVQSIPQSWDILLPYVLFALREIPHSATGFSPAEMVYGRKFRGLLHIMRETWTQNDPMFRYKNMSTAKYMAELNDKIEKTLTAARQNIATAESKMKLQYDKHSTERALDVGEWALVLLPTSENKVFSTWRGPFKVLQKCDHNNYVLQIDERRALFHINSLRRYHVDSDTDLDKGELNMMIVEDVDEDGIEASWDEQPHDDAADGWTDKTNDCSSPYTVGQQLTADQRTKLRQVTDDFPGVFADKPGKTHVMQHLIRVTDDLPCYQPSYRIPETLKDAVEAELMTMLEHGIIQWDDQSSHNSPLLVVRKPDGKIRLVNNFISLNNKTITEPYMMTNLTELVSKAAGSLYISRIDLQKAFYQLSLTPESQALTAFETHLGKFSYLQMPQGLKNAPASCSKLLGIVLRGFHRFCGSLIDDIVIFTKSFDLHLSQIRQVMERLKAAGLTANVSKCIFAANKLVILGYLLSEGKIYPQPAKLKVVANYPVPKTKPQLKRFLGLAGYFREFIPHYATIAFPLSELTGKTKPEKLQWGPEQQQAFERLRQALTSKPVLRPPNMNKPFDLWVDASKVGLSAILMQTDDAEASDDHTGHVICYGSRKLLPRERLYPVVELEILAIVFGLLKFKHYVWGNKIHCWSDHKPLLWLNSLVKHSSRLAKWALLIQDYDIEMHHVPGSRQIADALTRLED